jgi:predicted amidohydrolase YtcJ
MKNKLFISKLLLIGILSTVSPLTVYGGQFDQKATMVLKNGIVYTMEKAQPIAEAVAINKDKIVFVGSNAGVKKYIDKKTKVIDLKGKMVSPGFVDSHMHMPDIWPDKLFGVYLSELKSNTDYVKAVADFVQKNPNAKVVGGSGWAEALYASNQGPKKEDLDAVCPNIPVIITSDGWHSWWLNSKGLEMLGITKDTPNPTGGIIERNSDGSPSGTLRDVPYHMIAKVMDLYKMTVPQYKQALLKNQEEMTSYGITSVMTYLYPGDLTMEALADLEKEGKLNLRVNAGYFLYPYEKPEDAVNKIIAAGKKFKTNMLKFNVGKLMIDGINTSKTAVYLQPYEGSNFCGEPLWKTDELNKMVLALDKAGIQVHSHVVGDGANNMTINAYEAASKTNGKKDSRHTLIHSVLVQKSDMPRMVECGIIANQQPFWAYKTPDFEVDKALIGEKRLLACYANKTLWDAGVKVSFGSDFSSQRDPRPLVGIETGVTRNNPYPGEQDKDMVRNAAEALSVNEALQAYTENSAYQMFRENEIGSLKVGKKADLVVLGKDITKIPAKDISETPVVYTISNGRVVYEKK